MALLGEQFETPDFIAGVILKLKPMFDKISIWLVDSKNEEGIKKVKETVMTMLQIGESEIEFMVFKEQKNKTYNNKPFKVNKFKKDEIVQRDV